MKPSLLFILLVVLSLGIFWSPDSASAQNEATLHRPSRETAFPAFHPQQEAAFNVTDVRDSDSDASAEKTSKSVMTAPMVTVCSSLAVVLGLFAALVWVTRKYSNRGIGGGQIPSEVVQSLGSTAIDPRTRLTMLRVGNRILVLSQTASGIQPISEITDLEEVRHLTAVCTGGSKEQFASTLAEMGREPAQGFTDTIKAAGKTRQRGSLFATA